MRNRLEPEKGVFIAESPKVIHVALDAGYVPLALLCEQRHLAGDAAALLRRIEVLPPAETVFPVFTGAREVLAELTGYTLTRGVLCAMRRPAAPALEDTCRNARRVAIIDGVVDTTNIGAIFRSAAALNIDAVLLTPNSCDPLNRRSIRVSMGTVFLVPWTWLPTEGSSYQDILRQLGFRTVAMALSDDSVSIEDPVLQAIPRLAIILGTEGDGLPHSTIAQADYVARIPMAHHVDSLNVAAASAVAFWQLRAK